MKSFDLDLQLHSPHAAGVSKNMEIPVLARQARLKGLDGLTTGDILHPQWASHVKKHVKEENACFFDTKGTTAFIIGGELCDIDRVHHLFLLPHLEAARELHERLKGHGRLTGWGAGRPEIKLNAEKVAAHIDAVGGLFGPAHAFTPYFALYAHFEGVSACYKGMTDKVAFVELGLSADSYFADLIEENHKYPFLTSSDAHSPWPHRIGREFTRFELKKPSFSELEKAFRGKAGRAILLNAGLDPREGKYHCSACNQCYGKYSHDEAKKRSWRCGRCQGTIKRGVRDRILELASFTQETHPANRPPYQHILPLAEILQLALGVQSPTAKKVQSRWRSLVDALGGEIAVLLDAPIVDVQEVDEQAAAYLEAFRAGWVHYIPGGGGNYGTPVICLSEEEFESKKAELGKKLACEGEEVEQKRLEEFADIQ